jgi:hypothetical protein
LSYRGYGIDRTEIKGCGRIERISSGRQQGGNILVATVAQVIVVQRHSGNIIQHAVFYLINNSSVFFCSGVNLCPGRKGEAAEEATAVCFLA